MPDNDTLEFYDPIPVPHEEASIAEPETVDVAPPELTEDEKAEEAEAQEILAEEEARHKGKSGSAKLKERLERERNEKAEALARAERAEAALAAQQKPVAPPPAPLVPTMEQFIAANPQATYDDYESFKINFAIQKGAQLAYQQLQADKNKTAWEQRAQKIPDFDTAQAVQAVKTAAGTSYSPVIWDSIEESEQGPELLDHLRKHPEEARRLAGLNERQAVMELGRLEVRLAKQATPPTPKTTSAPPPVRPVAGRSAAPSPVSEDKEMY